MNYLQLVNRERVECGVSGNALARTQNQTGENARFTSWVSSAYVDVQSAKDDWNFMRGQFNVQINPGVQTITAAATVPTLDNWKKDSFRLSIKFGADDFTEEQLLPCMDYDEWRNIYQYGTMRTTQSRPTVVAVHPSKAIGFGPIPDKTYRFIGEFYRKPVEFVSDDDQPSFSDRYHMAIVYKAMMYYGGFESAPEVFSRGEYEFRRIMERLHAEELPTTMSGPPLA